MDGIFGVGIGEVLIIILVVVVIGGPQNAIKWSRDLGRMLRQAREIWQQMMKDLEKDLGEDGKEIMKATRDLTQNINNIRSQTSPRRLTRQATKMIEQATDEADQSLKEALSETDAALKGKKSFTEVNVLKKPTDKSEAETPEEPANNGKYSNWIPEDKT
ncbi:MAG TPA: hypothetical protein VJZ27_15025 [Aggregatilineales bacterium]|nr:hypothetical protein [Aggregatilineales bacterium]